MRYAMICGNRVIDIVFSDNKPEWPPTIVGDVIVAIECDDSVERGMRYDPETNAFFDPFPYCPPPKEPTQLDIITETQLIIMEAMAEQYEESLERDITNMEVQATIYEAILELGGVE